MDQTRKKQILLHLQRALNGAITSNIRAIFVGWNDAKIFLYFIFDGDISDDNIEDASCVETELISSLIGPNDNTRTNTDCIRIDAPKPIPNFGNECVYKRKEL